MIALGVRSGASVVLKVQRSRGEEWHGGDVLAAFEGRGVVPVIEHEPGAVLPPRLVPGESLVPMVARGDDDAATDILADVIARVPEVVPPAGCPTVEDWGAAFGRYLAGQEGGVPRALAEDAKERFERLCATQRRVRLLHGDLHHANVLFDAARGWLAIDPKGVAGELEYELGAMLRNPAEAREGIASPAVVKRRVERLARRLNVDPGRVVAWGFVQAVLATIWCVEDRAEVDSRFLLVATVLRPGSL